MPRKKPQPTFPAPSPEASATASPADADFPSEWDAPKEERLPPLDPARLAMRRLMQTALAARGVEVSEAGRAGVVTLFRLPGDGWEKIAMKAWRDFAMGGRDPKNNRGWMTRDETRGWACWTPESKPAAKTAIEDEETFHRALWCLWHCMGCSRDLDWLPADMVVSADHVFELPALSGQDVRAVAEMLTGSRATGPCRRAGFLKGKLDAVTPRVLRLARRPDQTADMYLAKLRRVLGRDDTRGAAEVRARVPEARPSVREAPTLDRIHGMDELVAWGRALQRDLALYRAGKLPWSKVDCGLVVSGPPGVGKTVGVRAIAASCGVPLISGGYGVWLGSGGGHQGSMLIAMRKDFKAARDQAPAILFMDEADSFPDRARIGRRDKEWDTQIVNAVLAEMDGTAGREGVICIAACNHPHKMDPALMRSGRLDRHIRVGMPDRAALEALLHEHLGDALAGVDLSSIAVPLEGVATGADCERYARGAERRARNAGRAMVLADLEAEVLGSDGERLPEMRRVAAVHEAGHALATCVLFPGKLRAVTLLGGAGGGGHAAMQGDLFGGQMRLEGATALLALALAGRAGEEEVFGAPSSGAGGGEDSDLARATALAVMVASAMQLDAGADLVWLGLPEPGDVPGMLRYDHGLRRRVQALLAEAYAAALELVRGNRPALDALAEHLLARAVLEGAEAEAIVEQHRPPRAA